MNPTNPDDFIELIEQVVMRLLTSNGIHVAYATLDPAYTGGEPRLRFEGEIRYSSKGYPRLTSYVPAPADRVAVLMVGQSGLILGALP